MIRLLVLLLSFFALSACGGGGGSSSNTSLNETPALTSVAEGIEFKRSSNPTEGVRWKVLSTGGRLIWFDPQLATLEYDITPLADSIIMNQNSEVGVAYGNSTNEYYLEAASGEAVQSTLQDGMAMGYNGEALMRMHLVDADQNNSDTVQKFGTASMVINFGLDTGSLSVTSNDGKSSLTSSVDLDDNNWLTGNGTFETSGDTYTDSYENWSAGCSMFGQCGTNYVTRNYDSINESTRLLGSLTGENGTGAMGVLIGNNHEVGITLE